MNVIINIIYVGRQITKVLKMKKLRFLCLRLWTARAHLVYCLRLGDDCLLYYNLFHQSPTLENYIPPSLMSGNLYCLRCVFSDRNFIVPFLHTNVLLIEGYPFIYRYRRLPCGYTPHHSLPLVLRASL